MCTADTCRHELMIPHLLAHFFNSTLERRADLHVFGDTHLILNSPVDESRKPTIKRGINSVSSRYYQPESIRTFESQEMAKARPSGYRVDPIEKPPNNQNRTHSHNIPVANGNVFGDTLSNV